jgi:hypothetical protein
MLLTEGDSRVMPGTMRISQLQRRGVGTTAFVIIGVVLIATAAALVITLASRGPAPSTAPHDSVTASVRAMDGKGGYVTNATLKIGDELKLIVTVPDWTSPIAVHQVFGGRVDGDLAWNVNATRYSYVIDSGPADSTDLGVHVVYVVVAFADGSIATSNNVTMTVTN